MTLKERIESRVSYQRIRVCGSTAYEASAFIDGVLYETIKKTKALCVDELVRKAERQDGIKAEAHEERNDNGWLAGYFG